MPRRSYRVEPGRAFSGGRRRDRWVDGPPTRAARIDGICYLDEIVEVRKDTTVVIHPLADDRRILPMGKIGELLRVPTKFFLAISYNPVYQSVLKDLKHSSRTRFIAIEFDYPDPELERSMVVGESLLDNAIEAGLVKLAGTPAIWRASSFRLHLAISNAIYCAK